MTQVETNFTINGKVVSKVAEFGGLVAYQETINHDEIMVYFTKADKVLMELEVGADCNQNQGFISELTFRRMK